MTSTPSKSRTRAPEHDLTPAMRQYAEQKASVPDALLLFRMGDFYETFYEDARTAARVLGIALTSRGKDRGGRAVPLAGIPFHALHSYLTKLVRAGFKVAISEQVEDPRLAKGVVRREIVRIVTPGTLTDDALLEEKSSNYLACAHQRGEETGLAFVELSTGGFWAQMLNPAELLDELVRLAPAELLLREMPIESDDPLGGVARQAADALSDARSLAITRRPPVLFDAYQAEQKLLKHFGVASLAGFGFDQVDASLCAAAVVLDYLGETQKAPLQHIVTLRRRESHDFVCMDQATWRSLEIERSMRSGSPAGSLLQAVDRTSSAMGARCLRRWLAAPLRDGAAIRQRQGAIADVLADAHLLSALHGELRQLADIERITARLGVGRASPRDLVALGQALLTAERIAKLLDEVVEKASGLAGRTLTTEKPAADGVLPAEATPSDRTQSGDTSHSERPRGLKPAAPPYGGFSPFLAQRRDALRGLGGLAEFLSTALHPDAPPVTHEGGIIAAGYDDELDRLRSIGADGRQWLADFQAREIERTGIASLKVGFNQVFGYYIEVTHTHRDRIPPEYVRKQTLKNAERYITDELKKYETEALSARDRANAREAELFEGIRDRAAEHIPTLQSLAAAAAEIDVVAGLAQLADSRRYVLPEITDQFVLEIIDGRHPVLEQTLAEKFVPNDCRLGQIGHAGDDSPAVNRREGRGRATSATDPSKPDLLMILTGPNMAGKSTYIRQIALLTLLAQTGSYVPAAAMRFRPVDRIFARVGASDEIARGQSTFMVEMTEAANILRNATADSLVIIDELGRGTSTFDGLALAWAIAEQLVTGIGCRGLFATHYHELTELENYLAGVVNYQVAVREWQDEVVFLHRIVRGGTDKSYGVHVARLAGIGPEVVTRSQELLAELESNAASPRRSPRRAARRTKEDPQLLLFTDPAEEIIRELRQTDPNLISPIDALKKLEQWRSRLGP